MTFKNRDVIALEDFKKEEILRLLAVSKEFKQKEPPKLLAGTILASCFFEPSTRTRLSFESAAIRLGGQVIGFADPSATSCHKGESLFDSMKVVQSYADVIVLRHPLEGAAERAAEGSDKPVINAGDGSHQHPTQTFLDLFSIEESQGTLDGISIALAGDLKYGRTVHSLAVALAHFKIRLYLISPRELEMPKSVLETLRMQGVKYSYHSSLDEVLPKLDVLYMTRIQQERYPLKSDYERVKNSCCLKLHHLSEVKPNFKVLHPLPKVHEIQREIDDSPHAYYFQQAANGLPVRQALLALILGKVE